MMNPIARIDAPAELSTFSTWNSDAYDAYRRGIPRYPRMNCGKKVRLNPAKIRTAATLPHASLYMTPNIFGHQ